MWPASPPHLNSGYPSSSVDPALLNSLACPTAARLDFLNRNTYALLVSAGKEYGPMDATMPSRWMTLQEVAEYLQLSKDMIYRLAQSGRIPASKVGSRWRFRRERIDRWMEDMAVDTEARGSRREVRE